MNELRAEIGRALAQQFESDRLLGVRFVPIAPPQPVGLTAPPNATGKRQAGEAAKSDALAALDKDHVQGCTKCTLCQTRTNTVFGAGAPSARIVFVGEAPGFEEDRQGIPFVGRAGQLLTQMIIAMGLKREDVYICNVLKCRPPNNRDPAADETTACRPYLYEQLRIIEPELIIALGSPAAKLLLNTHEGISRLRGRFHDFYPSGTPLSGKPIPLMPTYHPAYLLRTPADKGKAWSDLQMVMARLGLPLPRR